MLQFGDEAENLPFRCDKEGAGGVLWVKAFDTGQGAPLSAKAGGTAAEWKRSETVMRKNACLTALLLCLALFCAACGARMPGERDAEPAGPEQTAPSVPEQTIPVVVTEPPVSSVPLPEEPEAVDAGAAAPEEPEKTEAPAGGAEGPDGGVDYSGCYRDMQGTDEVYSDLTLSRQEEGNGLYDASIGLYRLAFLEGIAQVQEDGTLLFVGGPPKVQAVITIDGEQARVEFTVSEFEYIEPGYVYTFPDGKA